MTGYPYLCNEDPVSDSGGGGGGGGAAAAGTRTGNRVELDDEALDRLHALVISVVVVIGIAIVVGFVVCLMLTRGNRYAHADTGGASSSNRSRDTTTTTPSGGDDWNSTATGHLYLSAVILPSSLMSKSFAG